MLHQAMKLMTDMQQFVPDVQWYEIDYRFGTWLHKPKKSAPHLHILLPEAEFMEFLSAQPADSPIWPQGIANFQEFSLTNPAEKDYSLDRVYVKKKQVWYNNFTIVDNLLLETKHGLEVLLKNGVCDGSVGLRVGRPVSLKGGQVYQFFLRVSSDLLIRCLKSSKLRSTKEWKMQDLSF
eukprot:TRINITY_DN1768_c0_g1_i1.p1 TRINITY_DN1768_c0_g1~~TRINITY_DN1768_c0_g1_i1.p1  ORF type:complete len:179 (-),score=12.47 TRINITY_DN1768_c0_g1_i1:157-693(-)